MTDNLELSKAALRILAERYLARYLDGTQETSREMFWRVARAVAQADPADTMKATAQAFYDQMAALKFVPNSPTLMNAGLDNGLQLSACYVLPVEDSVEGIFESIKNAALIHKSGGGTGFAFGRLRPSGTRVNTSGGVASGPVSFMRVFDGATESIKQGGRRRGANMGILRVDHPDIEEFITCKLDGGITNFNISVAITEDFMIALNRGGDYDLIAQPGWPKPDGGRCEGGEFVGYKNARVIFDKIIDAAWRSGDPGLVFIDGINESRANPVPSIGMIEATNPCVTGDTLIYTEDGLIDAKSLWYYGKSVSVAIDSRIDPKPYRSASCVFATGQKMVYRLQTKDGYSLRLTANHKVMTERGWVEAIELKPDDQIHVYNDAGVTDFESLTQEGIETVYDLTEPVTSSFVANGLVVHNCGEQPLLPNEACNLGSINLARFVNEDGTDLHWGALNQTVKTAVHFLDNVITVNPYPLPEIDAVVKANRRIGLGVMGWADLLFALGIPYNSGAALAWADQVMGFINRTAHKESRRLAQERGAFPNWAHSIYKDDYPIRNSTVTTIAPTGSISIIAGASSGIEPIFALAFRHIVKQPEGGERVLTFVNPTFEQVAKEKGFWSEELRDKILETGSVHGLTEVPEDIRRIFVTAHEIAPEWHVRMQAAFQKHTDNGVSKTINLPNSATRQDIEDAYLLAYQTGCLGITVFRDGCKDTQVLNVGVVDTKTPDNPPPIVETPKVRPVKLNGNTYRKNTPIGTAYITVNTNGDGGQDPFEVFINVGKAGSDVAADAEGLGRLISLILRLPGPLSANERARDIVSQLRGIGSGRAQGFGQQRVMSLADAVAQAIAEHVGLNATGQLPGLPDVDEAAQLPSRAGDLCPECGQATFVFEEGCKKCYGCGYSEC